MCRCTPWLDAGSSVTSPVPRRHFVPARSKAAMRDSKSKATSESATIPSVPPTSSDGTIRIAPRPTASSVRGPSFIATSWKPKSDRNTPAVCFTSRAPTTSRLRRTGAPSEAASSAPGARRRVEGREQLDRAVTGLQERGAHALIPDQRLLHERQTEGVAVEPIRLCEVPDHDAHVMNPSHHARSLLIEADGGHAGPDP